ncbi:MAG: PepSY-associated TM helix domain-containing protein, partial [Armatimonadaceae bacterium]
MAARQRQPLRFRQGVFRIHQFLGALVGGYWILMAVTGAVLLYGEELERLLHPRWFALDTRGTPLPVSRLLEPVAARFPETPVEDIRLPRRAGDSVLFLLPDPNGGSTREVFVHPRSAAILGHRLESESWLLQVYRLHAELLLRDTGASVNGILALAASALLASSIPIWMPRNRFQWKQRFTVNIKSSRMRSLFDLHNVFGIAALPVLTTVVSTGIFFVYASRLEPVVHAVTGSSPAPEHAEPAARGNRLP